MPATRIIPSEAPKTAPTTSLLSDGSPLPRTLHLLSLVVSKEAARIPYATLVLRDGSPSGESFEASDSAHFEPGKLIEVQAGYRGEESSIFKGIVVKHGIKIRAEGSLLVVECRDAAMKMTVGAKSKYFSDVKDSDAAETILSAHGLEMDVESTPVTHASLVQYESTDWDFLQCRAEACGLMCFVSDGKVTLARPDFSATPKLTIQHGATLRSLDAEIDARIQSGTVAAHSWNPADAAILDGADASDPGLPAGGNLSAEMLAAATGAEPAGLSHDGRLREPELQAWADATLLRQRLAKIRGKVRTDGNATVLPGDLIELAGVGERFEGALFVTGVRHQIEGGNWETTYQFGIDPAPFVKTYDVAQPLAGGLLPPVQGLHIGVVTALEGDPDGEGRIQVRLPIISAAEEGVWSRVSAMDAGKERGTVFHPEIGDEVLVGFLNNDPRHPVVLGGLHSSKNSAPISASDDNHHKGYKTRSGIELMFDDDKKKVTIKTPAGHTLLLNDDDTSISLTDSSGNKLLMNSDGITLESIKAIKLKSATDLIAEAGTAASLKGGTTLKVEGSGTAEISSGGSTTVKGAIVQIN